MASIARIFVGVILLVAGSAIVYQSNYYHLVEIFTIIGAIIFIVALYLIMVSFFESTSSKKLSNHIKKQSISETKSKTLESKVNNKNDIKGNIATNLNSLSNNLTSSLGNNSEDNKLNSIDPKKIANKVKNATKPKNPKDVLKPMELKSNTNTKKFKFTPNYEKPVKVVRRPQKKGNSISNKVENVDNGVQSSENNKLTKSEEIARALASDDFIRPIHVNNESNTDFRSNDNINSGISENGSFKPSSLNASKSSQNNDLSNESLNSSPKIRNGLDSEINYSDENICKFLKSYVVCSKGTMTSQEAFEELIGNAKSEILLEISSIKDMTNEFLSKLSSFNVRIIIQEFDIKDMSNILLITSLIEQGIKIKTLPLINTINFITDDSHALIISENDDPDKIDIGAVYNDSKVISEIKSVFESSWELANDIDI